MPASEMLGVPAPALLLVCPRNVNEQYLIPRASVLLPGKFGQGIAANARKRAETGKSPVLRWLVN